jgi:O-acetyl-ADP-ribose deacetylase (regulator of RNase III)
VADALNQKILLWHGDLCALSVDAIVNTSNERLNDKTGISGRVFYLAGPQLASAVQGETCPTGDAVLTPGFNLHARNIIHTVGPRFSLKYQTAAENALHGCYRRTLEVLKDNGLHHIAFSVVNTDRKGFPRRPATHIALRTVRRFLERFGNGIETIVFCVASQEDLDVYTEILPLYFPRTQAEQDAVLPLLPADIGNDLGETVIQDRQIRISSMPGQSEEGRPSAGSVGDGKFQMPPKPHAEVLSRTRRRARHTRHIHKLHFTPAFAGGVQ